MTCRSGVLTLDGSKYLSMIRDNSTILLPLLVPTTKTWYLLLKTQKMKKVMLLVFTATQRKLISNGKFYILTKPKRQKPRDSMRNSDSTSTDLSILSLSYHSTESLRCLEEQTWSSKDGERTKDNSNSGLMRSQRPSGTTTGRITASISNPMVTAII